MDMGTFAHFLGHARRAVASIGNVCVCLFVCHTFVPPLSSGITQQWELESSFRFFVVITGCNDNDNMMLVVELVLVFVVNFAMNNMVFRAMNE